jgi:hypothetical protein
MSKIRENINTSRIKSNNNITGLAQVVVDTFDITKYRSAEYIVTLTSGGNYSIVKLLVIHDETNAYATIYGDMASGSDIGSFDVTINSTNLELLFTPLIDGVTAQIVKDLT